MIDHHVVEVWTDGSGTTAGNPGGWAYVMTTVHPTTAEVFERCESGFVSDATNNRAEMLALLMGLHAIRAPAVSREAVGTEPECFFDAGPTMPPTLRALSELAQVTLGSSSLGLLLATGPRMLSRTATSPHTSSALEN